MSVDFVHNRLLSRTQHRNANNRTQRLLEAANQPGSKNQSKRDYPILHTDKATNLQGQRSWHR